MGEGGGGGKKNRDFSPPPPPPIAINPDACPLSTPFEKDGCLYGKRPDDPTRKTVYRLDVALMSPSIKRCQMQCTESYPKDAALE